MTNYWESRQHLGYYVLVRAWLRMLSPGASILDVGCFDTPTVLWGDFQRRYTVDAEHDPHFPGVQSHVGLWLPYELPERMSVITCLQVLEHLPDELVTKFAHKLLVNADHTIVSVPYEWPAGDELAHLQDPISLEKFTAMMGSTPLEQVIVHDGRRLRLVARWENPL